MKGLSRLRPDHTTIARFRQRHEASLADLFGQVLELCAEAGLVKVGVIAIDETKVHANASQHAARAAPTPGGVNCFTTIRASKPARESAARVM
jgi:transposase